MSMMMNVKGVITTWNAECESLGIMSRRFVYIILLWVESLKVCEIGVPPNCVLCMMWYDYLLVVFSVLSLESV